MTLTATVNKWGNAEGIRLPASYCKQLGIAAGDKVAMELEKDKIIIQSIKEDSLEKYTLEGRLRAAGWDGRRHYVEEIEWGADVGAEKLFWEDEA
jgi:antitoxin component of MazEF toxin-antitoxin module